MKLHYTLSDKELYRANLTEHFSVRRWGYLRIFGGPALIGVGFLLRFSSDSDQSRGLGMFFVFYGLYYGLRPFLTSWFRLRLRRREGVAEQVTEIELSDDGIHVRDPEASSELSWDSISTAGAREEHYFIAIRGGARFVIPKRAVSDSKQFAGFFERKSKWEG